MQYIVEVTKQVKTIKYNVVEIGLNLSVPNAPYTALVDMDIGVVTAPNGATTQLEAFADCFNIMRACNAALDKGV